MIGVRISLMAAFLGAPLWAQVAIPGFETLKAADFQATELFNRQGSAPVARDASLSEPTRMDVQVMRTADGRYSHTNIWFVERKGAVKMYDGLQKAVRKIGTIATRGVDDNGLMGIALAPDFAASRWIYFWYSPNTLVGQKRKQLLTRIKAKANDTLDMPTEQVLIDIVGSGTDRWHSGGPMQFDKHGDLWIAIGNNSYDLEPGPCSVVSAVNSDSSAEWSSSNTASMFGGFLRIHPEEQMVDGKYYSIPAGNFGQYWADKFEQQGRAASLIADYRNPAKVLPEIYVKGERSNYSIAVHPTKRWLAWGTVNYSNTNDEFNLTKTPVFTGFPYFHKDNQKTCPSRDFSLTEPANNSPFSGGAKTLPPAVGGAINNLVNVSIGGPIYSFKATGDTGIKFPPQFDNTWILGGFGDGGTPGLWVAKLDTAQLKVSGTPLKVSGGLLPTPRNFIQGMYGDDGALYILNYDGTQYGAPRNPGVMRVIYKGPIDFIPEAAPGDASYFSIWVSGQSLVVAEKGDHVVTLHGMDGRLLHRLAGRDRKEYRLPDIRRGLGLPRGVYTARVKTARGVYSRALSLL